MSNEYMRRAGASIAAVIQPIVFSWIVTVLLAIFCFTISASSPALGELQWQDAARMGTSIWLLIFGGPLEQDGTTIGVMPLLATALVMWALYRSMRKRQIATWFDIGAGALTAFAVTSLIGLIALPGSVQLLGGLGAAVMVVACGLLLVQRPEWLENSWVLAKPLLLALTLLALIMFTVGLVTGWDRVREIQDYYLLGVFSTVIFALAQLFFLPNVLIWALAYISGVGFSVGAGTHFSPFGIASAPLPALPILGALPEPQVTMPWIIAVPIVIGIGIGLWRSVPSLKEVAIRGLPAFGFILFAAALAGALASGGIGPGRMSEVGLAPPLFGLAIAGEAGGGLLIGLSAPHLIEKVRQRRHRDDTLPE